MSLVRARSVSLDRVRCSLLHGLLSAVAPSKPQRIADAAWATPIPPAALRTEMEPRWIAGDLVCRRTWRLRPVRQRNGSQISAKVSVLQPMRMYPVLGFCQHG